MPLHLPQCLGSGAQLIEEGGTGAEDGTQRDTPAAATGPRHGDHHVVLRAAAVQQDLHHGDQDVERTAALGGGQLVDAVQQRRGQDERHRPAVPRSTHCTRGPVEARQARPGGRTREVFRPETLPHAVQVVGISGSGRIGRNIRIGKKFACILQAHEAPMSDEHD